MTAGAASIRTSALAAPELRRRPFSRRSLLNRGLTIAALAMFALAVAPLASVLTTLGIRGGKRLGLALFYELPPAPGVEGGGFGNALLGTLVMVGLAAAISAPVGLLAGFCLGEFAPDRRWTTAVRFAARVLSGMPSILAGVFAYAVVVLATGGFSAVAGGAALALVMLPTIVLTAEEAVRTSPKSMRDAALAMGATQSQTALGVVLPAAWPAMLTGTLLAVARAAGETAPLLFTALSSDYWARGLAEPTASLAVLIYNFSAAPFESQVELAWSAALVLVVLVLALKLTAMRLTLRSTRR